MLDSLEGICPGQAGLESPATSVSMHHWADPTAALTEISRVLRPGGRALVWAFRPGVRPPAFGPRHAHLLDPVDHARGAPHRVVNATPWPWPWRFTLTQRIELVRADGHPDLRATGRHPPGCVRA